MLVVNAVILCQVKLGRFESLFCNLGYAARIILLEYKQVYFLAGF